MPERILARLPVLDERLKKIASLVPEGDLVADIGCDHGKLTCYLVGSGRCHRAIASDISPISRNKARDLFERNGLLSNITIKGEDGLLAIAGETPDCVVIAGLGGGIIAEMLAQPVPLSGARLIVSAQSELPRLRAAINQRAYQIMEEWVVQAKGRYYLIINAKPGKQELSEKQRWLGYQVKSDQPALIKAYYSWQEQVASQWRSEEGKQYRLWLQEVLCE